MMALWSVRKFIPLEVMKASQGGACSLVPYENFAVVPLFLKNKLRCSPKFPLFPEIPLHVPLITKNIPHCSLEFLSHFISFMVSYFHRFYLVSHGTDTPGQKASLMTEK